MKKRGLFGWWRFHRIPVSWLKDKLDRNTFMIVSCILVGITAGAAAVAMKTLVHYMFKLSHNDWGVSALFQRILLYTLPLIGLLLTVWIVKRVLRGRDLKSLTSILYSVAKGGSDVPRFSMYSQLISTPITIGFGGSSGLEAPIAITGAAIGSNFGKAYKLNYRDKTLLLACGTAAGIAGIFNSPIAGVMFSIEVILAGISIIEFIPLILASVAGTLFSQIILKENILFQFPTQQVFNYANTFYYALLGLICGCVSLLYSKTSVSIEGLFNRIGARPYVKALVGGILLSLLCILLPPFFGEGYESISLLAEGKANLSLDGSVWGRWAYDELFVIVLIGIIGLLKSVATSLTLNGGGSGGNFAPSLFAGAHIGFFFSSILNYTGLSKLPVGNFTLCAMAGILSGVMYAPITSIFLIAEVTGGYGLIIPLMIVSSISYFFTRQFQPHSMAAQKLKEKGALLTEDRDKNLLTLLHLDSLVDKKAYCLYENDGKKEIMLALKRSHRNIFPVITNDRKLKGIIVMDQLKSVMLEPDKDFTVSDFIKQPDDYIQIHETMVEAMARFDKTGAWSLPVMEGDIFIGMMSKSQLLNAYRKELIKHSS